ncbi:uncharacterized protein LOC129919923 [Episyrphus balteatus]|uniref:uncharacterized protein LOC129919923 n=1 Tax=Episyrphus balteatus TaxID=286459 RepID=UPI00248550D6|nr:uncharacterized protein LOC129919923 [Episyrphus balteatus]
MKSNVLSFVILSAVFVAELSKTEAEFNTKFVSLVKNLNKAEKFDSIFIYKFAEYEFFNDFNDKLIRNISNSLRIPVILSTEDTSFYLKGKFNENLLTIVQFEEYDLFLQRLVEHLQHIRFCKIIFVLKNSARNGWKQLEKLFDFCWKNKMINVLAIFQDFGTSSTYYIYNHFGNFNIEELKWNENDLQIFPDRMRNLQGVKLPILFGAAEPGVIISENSKGNTLIGGFLGHLVSTFASKHNAKFDISNVNTSIFYNNIRKHVLDELIEIAGSQTMDSEVSIEWFSYPFATFDWGIMLPVEPNIPVNKVYGNIIHWEACLILILIFFLLSVLLSASGKASKSISTFKLNIDCFRGMLGQSFPETPTASFSTKINYSLIFLLGIMMVTSYDAFLQSFMTQPSREKVIKSFDDLQNSGLKILLTKDEIGTYLKLKPKFMKKYSNLFQVENKPMTKNKLRDTLNTKYAFTVARITWMTYKNQQDFSNQHLFRWSEELCLFKNKLSAMFINENSIFKRILNLHILETQSSGLFDFWVKRTFYELLADGKIQKSNIGFDLKLHQFKVNDLKWIWIVMGLMLMVATLCFVGEICIFKCL